MFGAHELFVACLESVLAHTPASVLILICDDAGPDPRTRDFVAGLDGRAGLEHRVLYRRQERTLGFPANVNSAFRLTAPADVVLLNSDCQVAEGWLDGLRAAAASDARVATVSTLTNHGSLVSIPERNRPGPELPEGWTLEGLAAAVRVRSLRLHPALPTAIGHCLYVRRSALELAGPFDETFSPGYGEEVDFSQRCLALGLTHVLADDVFVLHRGGASFAVGGAPSPHQTEHERILAARYPYYHEAVRLAERDVSGPLARALGAARRALRPLSVLIDARVLAGAMTGTQLHVLELIAALTRTGRVRVGVIVPGAMGADARASLDGLEGVASLTRAQLEAGERGADLVHRPFQIDDEEDLSFLSGVADRLVITQQDLISYHNPAYFRDLDSWSGYRRITRSALAVCDRVVFFSEHAYRDALAEDLLESSRASVVPIGVDHAVVGGRTPSARPAEAAALPDGAPVLLHLGTDFRHKNRLFSLRVLAALQDRHSWEGRLVFAGPAVRSGSSRPQEERWRAEHPRAAAAVLDLGAVSEAEKAWLYERAGLVLYPSVHEGFGLVPFEAAARGVPCLWASGTSLSEVLPDAAAAIVAWDPVATAEAAYALLHDDPARQTQLATVRGASARRSWDAAATQLIDVYQATCDAPSSPAGALERRHGGMAGHLSEDAMRLVGPSGALPARYERPLLALATHPPLARPVLGAITLGYAVGFRIRRLVGALRGDRGEG